MEELNNLKAPQKDPLNTLKAFTDARIGIGRTGTSIPLKQSLEFKLAHAHARDAVYSSLDLNTLGNELSSFNLSLVDLQSKAADRAQYLQRPDLGRQLSYSSSEDLCNQINGFDIVICIADGLSALAIHKNIYDMLVLLIPRLQLANYSIAPLCLIKQGRVAIADGIGETLGAKLSVIFIGERPGLSAVDSMSAYLTYQPKSGLTDDSRNCISNIRQGGLSISNAVDKLFYLIQESLKKKISGVGLKDNESLKVEASKISSSLPQNNIENL
jgi:ethanolamine ammonia-lyase small subunit